MERLRKTSMGIRCSLLAAVIAFGLCAGAASAETIKIGTLESPDGANTLGWKTFEQYVESVSGGKIDVDIYPSNQLGDSEKLLEGLKLGIHKMAQGDESLCGAYNPMLVWQTPYLFSDELVLKKFFESKTFAELNDKMAKEMGVRVLAAAPYGFYNFINKQRPVKKLEDLQGLKLRTLPNSQLTIKTWEALNASATPVSWGEIYTSIKTGVIDGLGHTIGIMVDQRYYEVAKHVTLDNSMACANLYLVNEKWYQSQPEDLKKVLQEGARIGAAAEFGIASYRNRVLAINKLKESGVEVVTLTDAERERFKKAAQDKALPWIREQAGPELVEKTLATIRDIEGELYGK